MTNNDFAQLHQLFVFGVRSGDTMKPSKLNVLFVCSRNRWRSPTAEKIYQHDDRICARSRGTTRNAVRSISSSDIAWANVVMVMEVKHSKRIRADFPAALQFKPIYILDIPDDFHFMDPELVALIRSAVAPIIDELFRSPQI